MSHDSIQQAQVQAAQEFSFVLTQNEPSALDFLATRTGISKQKIKDAMNKGSVWWTLKNKIVRLRRATKELPKGCKIQFYYDPHLLAKKPETPQLIQDEIRYSIWYKPNGLLSQGSQWGDHCSILRWVEVNQKRNCFLVHRLDADAAGLIILAHDPQAAAGLSELFQTHGLQKYYQAWVQGELPDQAFTINSDLDGKTSITHIKKIIASKTVNQQTQTLLDIQLETGRKHQIRRHLAGIGHPIIGDRLYGKAAPKLQLLAYSLEFDCPITRKHQKINLQQAGLPDLNTTYKIDPN
jgi:tRNA pseudouridine32 synthase / 23S rRNA pseudouridine746 synthase